VIPAASQLLAYPIALLGAISLVHQLSGRGTGVYGSLTCSALCVLLVYGSFGRCVHAVVGICLAVRRTAGLEVGWINAAALSRSSFDSTAAVVAAANAPYLNQALHSFFMGSGMGGKSPSAMLSTFIARLSYLHALPVKWAVELLRAGILVYLFGYFAVFVLSFLYWHYSEQRALGKAQSEITRKASVVGGVAENNAAESASAIASDNASTSEGNADSSGDAAPLPRQ
jgi:hypothetical protein